MSINEIKDINKLRQMLTESKAQEKYLKECCRKAGEELAKHSFEYDGKEKNLVVQAMELNEKYKKLERTLEEIKEYCNDQIGEIGPTGDLSFRATEIDILNIINKAKG